MAKTVRYQAVIWQDHSGLYTGRLLDDDEDGAAVSMNRREIVTQLKEYLQYLHKKSDFRLQAEFLRPRTRKFRVTVIPEYEEDKRTYASKESIRLTLPCVLGERESGLFTAMLPTLNLEFDYHDKDAFEELAEHYVRGGMRKLTPRQVSRFLPPVTFELAEIVVTHKDQREGGEEDLPETKQLRALADHLGSRDFKRNSRTWEREQEVHWLEQTLREEGTNVCIVGEPGCGKTSILVEAARRIELKGKRINETGSRKPQFFWMTSAGRIISGMRFLGQWEERFEVAVAELSNVRGILCLEGLLEVLKLGGDAPESSIAAFMLPFIQNQELRIVVEATPQELDACDRLLPGLVDQLQVLKMAPLDEVKSLNLLKRSADFYQQQEKVTFAPEAIEGIYYLFKRFQPYVAFPGKVIEFMGKLAERAADKGKRDVNSEVVREHFSEVTGLPLVFLKDELTVNEEEISKALGTEVLGQEPAVSAVSQMLTKFKAGLNDPSRPLGVFLFCGPTGVGKTALARALGNYLFGGKPENERLVRLDMSEYAGPDATIRLLGHPHGAPSELIRQIRLNPFTVLLLDEIEKAADEVFDVFLNVFEEGKLTDAFGRTTCFHSTMIIMTSNLGAAGPATLGFGGEGRDAPSVDTAVVKRFFRPEFFNRLDKTVIFKALSSEVIEAVTRKEMQDLANREGLQERGILLEFSDALVGYVAREGFDPKFGARPLQRKLEEMVTDPLAAWLVAHPEKRDAILQLDVKEGHLRIG